MGSAIMCPAGPRIDGFRPHFTLVYIKADEVRPKSWTGDPTKSEVGMQDA